MLKSLDLSGNLLTDRGLQRVVACMSETPDACSNIGSISLAQNSQLKLRPKTVLDDFAMALVALPSLTSLDLSGVLLQGQAVPGLVSALGDCPQLQSLSLAGCGLGRTGQADCAAVAALLGRGLGQRPGLEVADLSGNFFGRTGCAAAAAALRGSRLRRLAFAGNGCSPGPAEEREPHFNPIQLLIEGLLANQTLESLDLSDCGLGPDSAFVLEDALQTHPRIKALALMDNPLGEEGLRSIVRLLLAVGTDVSTCDVRGHRESDTLAHQVRFRYSQPSGVYSVNLRYPHERATLRTLLRFGGKRGSAFRFFKFDAKSGKPHVDRDPDTDNWMVPSLGTFSFAFQPPLSEAVNKLQVTIGQAQRSRVSSSSSVLSYYVEASVRDRTPRMSQTVASKLVEPPSPLPWRPGIALAPGLEVVQGLPGREPAPPRKMVMPHGRQQEKAMRRAGTLRAMAPEVVAEVTTLESEGREVAALLRDSRVPVSALRFPLVRAMFLSLITQAQQLRFIRACSKDVAFNAAQVTTLCEDRPELATRTACALFANIRGRSHQLMLLSISSPTTMRALMNAADTFLWLQEGNLTGRYCLNLSEPADCSVAENCLLVNAWESEVGRLLSRPDISQRGNNEMLRNEEHEEVPFVYTRAWSLPSYGKLCFDYSSIRRPLPNTASMPEASEVTKYLRATTVKVPGKLKALRAISVHLYLSAQQFKNIVLCFPEGADRQDVFCMLHTRVVNPARLLGTTVLHAPAVLHPEDRDALLRRVGHLQLFNPVHPDHVPYSCHLLVYEERMVIEFLVQLTLKEAGSRVIRGADEDYAPLPASWADKGVPCEDLAVKCTYEVITANVNLQWRQQLAEKYCVGNFHLDR